MCQCVQQGDAEQQIERERHPDTHRDGKSAVCLRQCDADRCWRCNIGGARAEDAKHCCTAFRHSNRRRHSHAERPGDEREGQREGEQPCTCLAQCVELRAGDKSEMHEEESEHARLQVDEEWLHFQIAGVTGDGTDDEAAEEQDNGLAEEYFAC